MSGDVYEQKAAGSLAQVKRLNVRQFSIRRASGCSMPLAPPLFTSLSNSHQGVPYYNGAITAHVNNRRYS